MRMSDAILFHLKTTISSIAALHLVYRIATEDELTG